MPPPAQPARSRPCSISPDPLRAPSIFRSRQIEKALGRDRAAVGAYSGCGGQICGGSSVDRMPPPGRDLGQRPHDEQTVGGPGMRQAEGRGLHLCPTVGNQVEVQGPRCIGGRAGAPMAVFDPVQGGQDPHRIEGRLDNHDGIDVIRSAWVRPRLGAPPSRNGNHGKALRRKAADGRGQGVCRPAKETRKVPAECYYDRCIKAVLIHFETGK